MIISSCIRLMYTIDNRHVVGDFGLFCLWTNIEPDIAIICACLPVMMPLIRSVRRKLSSEATPPSFLSKALPPSLSHWPYRKKGAVTESILNTDRSGFTYLSGDAELTTATSWSTKASILADEEARPTEHDLGQRNLCV